MYAFVTVLVLFFFFFFFFFFFLVSDCRDFAVVDNAYSAASS